MLLKQVGLAVAISGKASNESLGDYGVRPAVLSPGGRTDFHEDEGTVQEAHRRDKRTAPPPRRQTVNYFATSLTEMPKAWATPVP